MDEFSRTLVAIFEARRGERMLEARMVFDHFLKNCGIVRLIVLRQLIRPSEGVEGANFSQPKFNVLEFLGVIQIDSLTAYQGATQPSYILFISNTGTQYKPS